jgi:hypothetical protein
MNTYLKLGFSEQVQVESLQCRSSAWRLAVLEGMISGQRVMGKLAAGPFEMIRPQIAETFDYLPCGALDIISEELRGFLVNRVHAEFLPIVLCYRNGKALHRNYFVMHILDAFDAMDCQNSIYEEYSPQAGGGICKVTKLAIDKEVVGISNAFVLNELGTVFFSDRLCSEINDAGFNGLKFTGESQYQFG